MPAEEALVELSYLSAAVLFIRGLKSLSHPRTAVRGKWTCVELMMKMNDVGDSRR